MQSTISADTRQLQVGHGSAWVRGFPRTTAKSINEIREASREVIYEGSHRKTGRLEFWVDSPQIVTIESGVRPHTPAQQPSTERAIAQRHNVVGVAVGQDLPHRLRVKQGAEHSKWQHQPSIHLSTTADTAETPIAEVLAIIGQQPIIVLAETRARAPDNLFRRILWLEVIDDPHPMTVDKARQKHLLDRSALPEPRET